MPEENQLKEIRKLNRDISKLEREKKEAIEIAKLCYKGYHGEKASHAVRTIRWATLGKMYDKLQKQFKNCKEQNLRLIKENKRVMKNKINVVFSDIEKEMDKDCSNVVDIKIMSKKGYKKLKKKYSGKNDKKNT